MAKPPLDSRLPQEQENRSLLTAADIDWINTLLNEAAGSASADDREYISTLQACLTALAAEQERTKAERDFQRARADKWVEAFERQAETMETAKEAAEAEVERLTQELDTAKAMFWPHEDDSKEAHLYEIRNGKNADYVMAHADAMIEGAAEGHVTRLQAQIEALQKAWEADATDLWTVTNKIREEIRARQWVTESRGSYEWDDERYRDETRHAFDAVAAIIDTVQPSASNRYLSVMRAADAALLPPRVQTEGEQP